VCKEFELIEVKVPIKILGTVGFSLRRDVRYLNPQFDLILMSSHN
jgi:hypothetical protein